MVQCSAVRRSESWAPSPPSLPRPYRFATGIIWHCFTSCRCSLLKNYFHFWLLLGNEAVCQRCFFISRPPERSFPLGISNHMWAALHLPRCEEQEEWPVSSKAALTSPWNPVWRPRISLCSYSCKYFWGFGFMRPVDVLCVQALVQKKYNLATDWKGSLECF